MFDDDTETLHERLARLAWRDEAEREAGMTEVAEREQRCRRERCEAILQRQRPAATEPAKATARKKSGGRDVPTDSDLWQSWISERINRALKNNSTNLLA